MNDSQSAILELLRNYSHCEYPLSFEQIHHMLTVKIHRAKLVEIVQKMLQQKLISNYEKEWYSIAGDEILFQRKKQRVSSSSAKRLILNKYVKMLSFCPWITSIILTGSLAINNATINDDIDLMVITAPDSMFICRLYAYILAKMLGVARKPRVDVHPDAICINIWLDGRDMRVPTNKISVYGAREIVSAQVIVDKNKIFDSFVEANKWIYEKLPNWEYQIKSSEYRVQSTKRLVRALNNLLGRLQLWYMRPHITHEVVSTTQLWFHPKIRY